MKYLSLSLLLLIAACSNDTKTKPTAVKQDTLAVCDTIKNVKIKYLDSITIKADDNP